MGEPREHRDSHSSRILLKSQTGPRNICGCLEQVDGCFSEQLLIGCKLQRDKSADSGEFGPLTLTFVFVSLTGGVIGMHGAAAATLSCC